MSGRKPRSDAKLKSLPGQLQAELRDWFVEENVSYAEARKRLKDDHGITTSIGSLQDFYATHCFSLRFEQAKNLANELKGALEEAPEIFTAPAIGAISQRVFELAASKEANVGDLVSLAKVMGESAKLAIKERELSLSERRVALLEKKAAAFDEAAGVAGDGKLSAEEKDRRLKTIFGFA